jgi:hypothetical protein
MDEDSNQDQYKTATKAVDDAMRMDVLGARVVDVIEKYKPATDSIEKIIDQRLTNRKGKGVEKIIWQVLLTSVGLLVSFLVGRYLFQNS